METLALTRLGRIVKMKTPSHCVFCYRNEAVLFIPTEHIHYLIMATEPRRHCVDVDFGNIHGPMDDYPLMRTRDGLIIHVRWAARPRLGGRRRLHCRCWQ